MKLIGHLNRINAFYEANEGGGGGGEPAAVADPPAPVTPEVGGGDPVTPTPASDEHWARQHGFTDEQIGKIQNKGWEGLPAMADSYFNLEAFQGVGADRLLKIPEADDADGVKAMYERLGAPSDVEGYKFDFQEGMEVNGDMHGRFKENVALKHHFTPEQHAAAVQFQIDEAVAQQEANETAIKTQNNADIVELKNKWGSKYEERMDYAERAMRASGMTEDQVTSMQSVLGGPAVAEHFSKFADMMGEDKIAAETGSTSYGTSIEQVNAEIQDILSKFRNDPELLAKHQEDLSHPKAVHLKETKRLAVLRAQRRKFQESGG